MTHSTHDGFVSALLLGDYQNERLLVHDIFRKRGWRLFEARDRRRGMEYLDTHPVQVVMAESHAPRWNWKAVLSDLRRRSHPPQLIVTSRVADDSLWAEVLNIGGYDVLARPFEPEEVERVVGAARRHYRDPGSVRTLESAGAA